MVNFIKGINEDAKVTICLVMAQKVFEIIDENNEGYEIGKEALDTCWEWLKNKNIEPDILCDYVDNRDGDEDISGIAYIAKGKKYALAWHIILYAVLYTTWQAYNNNDLGYPGVLDNVDDKILPIMAEHYIESEIYNIKCLDKVKNYLLENYPVGSNHSEKPISKEDIMKMVDDNY